LITGPLFSQEVLVNTRLHAEEAIHIDETFELDLRDCFQMYPAPGPVATLTVYMPVPDKIMYLTPDLELSSDPSDTPGVSYTPLMTYKRQDGTSYDDPFAVTDAADFIWETHAIEYQLFADEAPVTVANFMTYAKDGAYANTVIHRNESTGWVFQGGGSANFNPLPIIQTGGVRIAESNAYPLEWIPTNPPIPLEQTRDNTLGTIAMARLSSPDSATSQFFMNLADNTRFFGNVYAVFGELMDPEADQPVLDQFAQAPVYDLTSSPPRFPFNRFPLYIPVYDDRDSFARFQSVEVTEGNPDGFTYAYEWVDLGEEGVDEEEEANRAVFSIQLDASTLKVSRSDSGFARLRITGTNGSGDSLSFDMALVGYNGDALTQFPNSEIFQGGWIENLWYGWMNAEQYPQIVHLNHGYQMVGEKSNRNSLFVYDYVLKSWLYTTIALYPNLYHYKSGHWLYFLETSSTGPDSERWFYITSGENPRWVRESELAEGEEGP